MQGSVSPAYEISRDHPEVLLGDISTERRLQLTLSSQKTSLRLVMFQVAFLELIGRPAGMSCQQIIKMYDGGMGTSHPRLRRELHTKCKTIYNVDTWQEFFDTVRVTMPSDEFLGKMLQESVVSSHSKRGITGANKLARAKEVVTRAGGKSRDGKISNTAYGV